MSSTLLPDEGKKKHQMESVKQLNAICSLHLQVFFQADDPVWERMEREIWSGAGFLSY